MSQQSWVEGLESRVLFSVPSGFVEKLITGSLPKATRMALAPDGRIFVTLQTGELRVVKNGALLPNPAITLTVDTTSERGLDGIVLDPNFSSNHFVYLYYTANTPTIHNRLSRFTFSGDTINTASRVDLIDLPAVTGPYHYSGGMRFGDDGKLYLSVGDNAVPNNAQDLSNPFGKILRLNRDGSIPTDGPFYSQATGLGKAIYAMGMRNPYGFDIQPGTGKIFSGDVGPGEGVDEAHTWEEVNAIVRGGNYGWPLVSGKSNGKPVPANYQEPVHTYNHGINKEFGTAVTGGAFYNPDTVQFPSSYVGKYFFTDYSGKFIKTVDPSTKAVATFATGAELDGAVDLITMPDGSLLVLTRGATNLTGIGKVYKITYTASNAPNIVTPPSAQTVAVDTSVTFTVQAGGQGPLTYQWQRNNQNIDGATASSYKINDTQMSDDGDTFRVIVKGPGGTATSTGAKLTVIDSKPPIPVIATPSELLLWKGGETIDFSGSATDPETGDLDGSDLTWQVDYFTGGPERPALQPVTGSSGSFTAPTIVPYLRPDVFFRIFLTATDPAGLSTTTSVDIQPLVVDISLETNIPGLKVNLDGQPVSAPVTNAAVAGLSRTLGALASQTVGGKTYDFVGWSDGGAATHTFTVPDSNTTYTATYKLSDTPPPAMAIGSLTLINADTDKGIGALTSGTTINLKNTPRINVSASPTTKVGSVVFKLDGKVFSTENTAPYSLGGDNGTDYLAWTPAIGSHTLVVTPYSGSGGSGTAGTAKTVTFTVISGVTATSGLKATYFDNSNFTGKSVSRTDSTVNFNWASAAPVSGIGADTFSVRWTGQVLAPKTGNYTFQTVADDGVRLWIDGKLVIDKLSNASGTRTNAPIALVAGKKYAIRLDYFENVGTASIQLKWSGPGIAMQVIPTSQLSPT